MAKIYEIAHVSEAKTAKNGNRYIMVSTKATKENGLITPGKRVCVWEDFDLYEVGDKIELD